MFEPHVLCLNQTRKCSSQPETKNNILANKEKIKKQISSMDSKIHGFLPSEYSTGCPLLKFESGLIRREIKARLELEKCATKSGHVTALVRTFEEQRKPSRAIKHKSNITARFVLGRFTLEALNNELHRRLQLEQDTDEKDLFLLRPLQKQNMLELKGRKLRQKDCYSEIKVMEKDKYYLSSNKKERFIALWNNDNPASKRWQVPSHEWETTNTDKNGLQLVKVGLETIYEEGSCMINNDAADKDEFAIYNASHQKTHGKFFNDARNDCTSSARNANNLSNGKINKDKNNNIITRSYGVANLEPDISLNRSSFTHILNDNKTILEKKNSVVWLVIYKE